MDRIAIALGQNIALLLSATLLYGALVPLLAKEDEHRRAAALGLFFSLLAFFGMFLPVTILPGVTIDGRVVVVSVAAAVGGPWAALTVPLLPVIYRLYLGGVGGPAGAGALVGGAVVGYLFYARSNRHPQSWSMWRRLALGVAVAIQALLWTFALPYPLAITVLPLYALPVLLLFPLGCVSLATLLAHQDQRLSAAKQLRVQIELQQRTEDSLRQSESRFRALAEHIQEVFWISDANRTAFIYVSPACLKIWGRTVDELYRNPKSWFDAIEGSSRGSIAQAVGMRQQQGGYDEEYQIVRPDGGLRWIRDRAFPVRDEKNKLMHVVGIAEDVTIRKNIELALREQEEKLRAIFDHSVDGLCFAVNGAVVLVNRAFLMIVGKETEEAMLHTPVLDWAGESKKETLKDLLESSSPGSERSATVAEEYADGRPPKLVEVRVAKYGPQQTHTLWVARDITTKSRLEEQLRQAQKMEAIGQLAGGIAHDFNNLLAAIGGNAELIEMNGTDERTLESLGEIGKAVARAKRLVGQILAFSRKTPPERRPTLVEPIIDEVLALLRATIPAGIRIVKVANRDVGAVWADPSQLHQVILNLFTNAWHAVESKAPNALIQVQLEARETPNPGGRSPQLAGPGTYVCLSVIDNGVGMNANDLQHVFEPFFTTKRTDQGTGLGLSVVHGIVASHGGQIFIKSEPGVGTTVDVYLPALPTSPNIETATTKTFPQGHGKRILFVDDELSLVSLATRVLNKLGYHVTAFSRSAEAIAAFREQPDAFDLVVTDLNMPEHSGLDVAQAVLDLRPNLPVFIASGFIADEVREKAMKMGVKDVIYKTATVEEFSKIIAELAPNGVRSVIPQ